MKNFNYCIWLTSSNKKNIWYKYTNGFQPHITIKYNLSLKEAEKYSLFLNKEVSKEFKIKLSDELFYSYEEDFYCLYKKAYIINDTSIEWFPIDAHVSFYYSYSPISIETKEEIDKNIMINTEIFDEITIKYCNNHFLSW